MSSCCLQESCQDSRWFKPLLDAYQGPHKIKFYYWTGLQLSIRAVFFGVAALDKNINLMIGSVILSMILGIIRPFKNNTKTYHEILFHINLQVLYTFTLSGLGATAINTMIAMAALHFAFIVSTNIITFMCGGVVRNKLQWCTTTMIRRITMLYREPNFVSEHLTLNDIPEVTYNYRDYQEPLIGMVWIIKLC